MEHNDFSVFRKMSARQNGLHHFTIIQKEMIVLPTFPE